MPRAAQGRFQPSGKRLQLSRQYNVSIDTGAFEIPPSSSRAPDASTLQSVEVRPARKHLHAQPVPCVPVRAFLGWIRARAGTCREHAACNTTILAGWRMREQFSRRTNAHADSKTHAQRAFVWSLWALVSRLVSKQNVCHGQHGT
jgi:hypothetical protein